MLKEIREVNKEKGIVRITTPDSRWYVKSSANKVTGLPEYQYVPSVTWICSVGYAKGPNFIKWAANQKDYDAVQAIKNAAGDRGSKIHLAIADLLAKKEVKIDDKYPSKETDIFEELTPDEYGAVISFKDWYNEVKPEVLGFEYVVFNDSLGYAGTVDLKCRIGNEVWIIDVKSGQNIWPEYELQVSAYKACESEVKKIGILQVGYNRIKSKYKFTEIEDKFSLFLAARQIWANETEGIEVPQKDYPLSISLLVENKNTEKKEKLSEESSIERIDIGLNKRSPKKQ